MQEAKSSAFIVSDYDTPCRNALLLTAGIHSIARLALAVTGSDVRNMNNELPFDSESDMDEADFENVLAECLEIIESANRHMLSAIIERGNSS